MYLGSYFYFVSIQEDRFKSRQLLSDYTFEFETPFEEFNLKPEDGALINSLLFKADSSVGVVCFWKGNGGALDNWGKVASLFTQVGYDVAITDYRQHGKSKGSISMDSFYSDAQLVYDFLKTRYPEGKITLVGYSLGTAIASYLSAGNSPQKVILIDPKVNFEARSLDSFFFLFPSVNKFPFQPKKYIEQTDESVVVICGKQGNLYADALSLKSVMKKSDCFFEIADADHRTILGHSELTKLLHQILNDDEKSQSCF